MANLESSLMLGVSDWALKEAHVQHLYAEHSWGNLKRHFPENLNQRNDKAVNGSYWALNTKLNIYQIVP